MPPPTQIVTLAYLRSSAVGGQEQVVEVLPRVVPAGAATLDVDDDVAVGHLGGDLDDGLDLVDRARLEHHVGDADGVELLDQVDGLFEVRDACGDDHAVDRRTGLAGLLHQPLAADLQLPQVRIEEQRVELNGAARLQQLGQLGDAAVEDLFGDLTAAGELGPVAGVGRGGDDLGVDRRRGHACEQDRRPAGEAGELGRHLHRAVGQLDRASARSSTRRAPRAGAAPTVNRLRCPARVAAATMPMPRPRITGAVSRVTVSLGPRSMIHLAPAAARPSTSETQSTGLMKMCSVEQAGQIAVQAGARGPLVDQVDAGGQPRGVEADLDVELVEHRAEDGAAARLVLALGFLVLGDLRRSTARTGPAARGFR